MAINIPNNDDVLHGSKNLIPENNMPSQRSESLQSVAGGGGNFDPTQRRNSLNIAQQGIHSVSSENVSDNLRNQRLEFTPGSLVSNALRDFPNFLLSTSATRLNVTERQTTAARPKHDAPPRQTHLVCNSG